MNTARQSSLTYLETAIAFYRARAVVRILEDAFHRASERDQLHRLPRLYARWEAARLVARSARLVLNRVEDAHREAHNDSPPVLTPDEIRELYAAESRLPKLRAFSGIGAKNRTVSSRWNAIAAGREVFA